MIEEKPKNPNPEFPRPDISAEISSAEMPIIPGNLVEGGNAPSPESTGGVVTPEVIPSPELPVADQSPEAILTANPAESVSVSGIDEQRETTLVHGSADDAPTASEITDIALGIPTDKE